MKVSDFNYELPAELIAQHPLSDRAAARMLVLNRSTHTITHCLFQDLGSYLKPDDAVVLNNTRVFKARLQGQKKTGGHVELLLVREMPDGSWETMLSHARRIQPGTRIYFNDTTFATVEGRTGSRWLVSFNTSIEEIIATHGAVPLPHYIKRKSVSSDAEYYQTVFAKNKGSIAAPTAGLHFTEELIVQLIAQHVSIEEITLHIGPGTFKPIRTKDIEAHVMEPEFYEISDKAITSIQSAHRVIAVGTSVCRALETYARTGALSGQAHIFIYPGFKFQSIDCLITNFHLPCSTPLLLVCAFAGKEVILRAYQEAMDEKYRFLSYGDGMLIV